MIVGHVNFGVKVDHFIYALHIPLFLFVSGLFINCNVQFDKFVKNKARKILIPYLSFGIFYYIIWLFLYSSKFVWYVPLKHLLWFNSDGMQFVGVLWFLTEFFVANIICF